MVLVDVLLGEDEMSVSRRVVGALASRRFLEAQTGDLAIGLAVVHEVR